jgi:Na+/H+ antiporter NhaD/arsenite permease-like protein
MTPHIQIGILMMLMLLAGFVAMARYNVSQALIMPLLACAFLVLQGDYAETVVRQSFSHFADIAILFTAVAIPAHMIDRSQGVQWFAALMGRQYGVFSLSRPKLAIPLVLMTVLLVTFVIAALMHNVTSILIMTPIIIRLCSKYEIPSRWLLSGALIASNLGGFSTRWGDTPNIVEARTWELTNADFMRAVLLANFIVLCLLWLVVWALTESHLRKDGTDKQSTANPLERYSKIAKKAVAYGNEKESMDVDQRLLLSGGLTLIGFIVFQAIFPKWQIAIGAMSILLAVLLERNEERLKTLKSLDFEVYFVFAAIFVLAGCVEHSWIDEMLRKAIERTGGAPWAIAATGYLGTALTEAASWATAASAQIHPVDPSHTAAWALGGGVCAGSSSILTAASAGIILWAESSRANKDHAVSFKSYLVFGLPFSILMLIFYAGYFTLRRF